MGDMIFVPERPKSIPFPVATTEEVKVSDCAKICWDRDGLLQFSCKSFIYDPVMKSCELAMQGISISTKMEASNFGVLKGGSTFHEGICLESGSTEKVSDTGRSPHLYNERLLMTRGKSIKLQECYEVLEGKTLRQCLDQCLFLDTERYFLKSRHFGPAIKHFRTKNSNLKEIAP